MEIGISTFADIGMHPVSKENISAHTRLRQIIEEMELADQVGLDVFALGEHHRPDYAISAPAVVLAAGAERTKNIRLSSAVTVLSSEDPVRVFQQFATLDLLSSGRAEIMAGRGSFIESFPLFGFDLNDYNELFSEKLAMLVKLVSAEKISWEGKLTQSINNLGIYPRPYQKQLPIWIGVGGTPQSVIRAAEYGLPMTLAIIGGMPARFVPFADLYRKTYQQAGHDMQQLQFCLNTHTFIADESKQARNEYFPTYAEVMTRLGRERGWPPMSRQQFEAATAPDGALHVGSPQEIIDKVLHEYELFGQTRFMAHTGVGVIPHKLNMRNIELLGTVVAPAIRKYTAAKKQLQKENG